MSSKHPDTYTTQVENHTSSTFLICILGVEGLCGWWWMVTIKKSEGAWDSGSRGEGSAGVKASAMGLWLWGQTGVWTLGRVPGWLKALGWAYCVSDGREGHQVEFQKVRFELGTGSFPKANQKCDTPINASFPRNFWLCVEQLYAELRVC